MAVQAPTRFFARRRWPATVFLALVCGCQAETALIPNSAKRACVSAVPAQAHLGMPQAVDEIKACDATLDLGALWQLAQANSPSLREAEADVEAARGQRIQAGKYPNPRFAYSEDLIGARVAPGGNQTVQFTQEIVTGGKRRLDMAIADRASTAAALGLMSRKYEVMTRLRRAYYAYLTAITTVELNEAAVTGLRKGVETTRRQVAATGRRTDLLRLEALLEQTKIGLARSQLNVAAAWMQVTGEIGVADLPPPHSVAKFPGQLPEWSSDAVRERVLAVNTNLSQARTEIESARLAVDRARAEAIPNITVGAGYVNAPIETTAGAIVTVEAPLPLWDRKQGQIRAAQARWLKAQASARKIEVSLTAASAEAWTRYQSARVEVDKLGGDVLPRLQESLDLLVKGYQSGGAGVTFTDVLTTRQTVIETRQKLADARQTLWLAVADLQGLMQRDIGED